MVLLFFLMRLKLMPATNQVLIHFRAKIVLTAALHKLKRNVFIVTVERGKLRRRRHQTRKLELAEKNQAGFLQISLSLIV